MALIKKKPKELSIKEKVMVIRERESGGKSQRELAKNFGVSKTQIQNTLKRKADFLAAYGDNLPNDRKRVRVCQFEENIDALTFRWFQRAKSQNLPINGPLIQEKARSFAKFLNKDGFKASNGWLNRFKARHSISQAVIYGNSGCADEKVAENVKSRLSEIPAGYSSCDIYNMGESEIFFRAFPEKNEEKGAECKGGRKEQITAMFCVNMDGEFDKTLVIGKNEKPLCFKSVDTTTLPVIWEYNKKAYMTSEIYQKWLENFDRKMQRQNRHVLLLLHNTPSHTKDVKVSNVKVVFLPTNTTSLLQPLDQGIIKVIKSIYRKLVLQSVLAKMNKDEEMNTFLKQVSVLDAIHWIHTATREIHCSTVTKCFLKCGIGHAGQSTTAYDEHIASLDKLVSKVQGNINLPSQSVDECVTPDNDVETCDNTNTKLENQFLDECFGKQPKKIPAEDDTNLEPPEVDSPTENCSKLPLTSIKEALKCVNDIKSFLLERDAVHILTSLYQVENGICEMSTDALKQRPAIDFCKDSGTLPT